jgi:hypothetical protein
VFVPTLVSVTVAPGTTPPDVSRTVPWITPVSTWAAAGRANIAAVTATTSAPHTRPFEHRKTKHMARLLRLPSFR